MCSAYQYFDIFLLVQVLVSEHMDGAQHGQLTFVGILKIITDISIDLSLHVIVNILT